MKSESEVSCVRLLATPWTAAYQASPSMGFSRQECWSVVPLPSLEYTSTLLHIRKNTLLLLQYYIFLKNLTKSFLLCKQLASTIFIILKVSYLECYFKPFYDKKKLVPFSQRNPFKRHETNGNLHFPQALKIYFNKWPKNASARRKNNMCNYNKTCPHSHTQSQHPPFCFRSTILLFSMQCFIKSQFSLKYVSIVMLRALLQRLKWSLWTKSLV